MIPNCFKDYIGVRHVCPGNTGISLSGLYIDDLAGINLETAASISVGGRTGYETLLDSIRNGIHQTLMDFKAYAQPYYYIKSVLSYSFVGDFNRVYSPATVTTRLKGLRIRQTQSYNCNSCNIDLIGRPNMQRLYIDKIQVLSNTAYTQKQIIIDDGGNYTYFYVDVEPNKVSEITVNYRAETTEVGIYIDNWDFSVSGGQIYGKFSRGCSSCSGGNFLRRSPEVSVVGFDGVQETHFMYGINPSIKVSCDEDLLFCAIGDKLKNAFLYASAVDFLRRWKVSQRYNEFTDSDVEVDYLSEEYKSIYDKEMKHLQVTLRDLLRTFDGNCIYCKGVKVGYSL
jgi:hypothetical protein